MKVVALNGSPRANGNTCLLYTSSQIMMYLKAMFGIGEGGLISTETLYNLSNFGLTLLIGVVFATPLMNRLKEHLKPWMLYVFYAVMLVLSTAYLVDSTFNPFLYFRF